MNGDLSAAVAARTSHSRRPSGEKLPAPLQNQLSSVEVQMPAPHQIEETLKTFQWIEAIRSSDLNALDKLLKSYDGMSMPFGTPLHLASAFASMSVFENILDHVVSAVKDFNINMPDSKGNTCLHLASKAGRVTACELLLKHNADCCLVNKDGQDSSEIARTQAVIDVILKHRKSFVLSKSMELLSLATSGNLSAVQDLFNNLRTAKLVNINMQDPMTGDTLLHIACEQNDVEMVAWLLKMRSDPLMRDKRGKLPVEKTKNDRIKQLIKGILNQGAFASQSTDETGGIRLQGFLYKWTNYASGYKRRWFVLQEGTLYYYHKQEDAPVSCRGSMSLQFSKLIIDASDKNRFELIGKGGAKYHLRAEHVVEAKRWIIALTESKQWLQDHVEFKNRVRKANGEISEAPMKAVKNLQESESDTDDESSDAYSKKNKFRTGTNDANSLHSIPLDVNNDDKESQESHEENFYAMVNSALAGVHSQQQLFFSCLTLLQNNPNYDKLTESVRKSSHALLNTLNELLRVHNVRERYWHDKLEREEALKKIWEENLRVLAVEHDSLQQKAAEEVNELRERAKTVVSLDDASDEDEFFDVQDNVSKNQNIAVSSTLIDSSSTGYPQEFRNRLPVGSADRPSISLWSVLKNNIGKDLSKIPLPVFFNEPLSMLQRLCEDMEYSTLLDIANSRADSLERIQYVAAFAMSNYSSTIGRTGKPFNPLLGETFEYVRKDRGFRYIAEQVSHHPPISACHCESDNYIFWASAQLRNKFWGKSLEISPQGRCHVILKNTDEYYSWQKVTTSVNNLIVGKLWIDHYGDMLITNHKTNETCLLTFKPAGWRGKSQYEISGIVKDSQGDTRYELSGAWNERLISKALSGGEHASNVLWKVNPLTDESSEMYNFSAFALTLNALSNDLKPHICKTDSRLRPDQRYMENGEYDAADKEKGRLEDKQRNTRYDRNESGIDWQPKWFKKEKDEWLYSDSYWQSRNEFFKNSKTDEIF